MVISLTILSIAVFFLFYGRISTIPLVLLILVLGGVFALLKKKHSHGYSAVLSLDSRARSSGLNQWSTSLKVGFGLIFAFCAILSRQVYVPVFIFIVMSLMTLGIGKTKASYYLSMLNIPMVFVALSAFGILITFSDFPSGILNFAFGKSFLVITSLAQEKALLVIIRAFSALSCLYFISLSTPIDKIMTLLKRLHFPSVIVSLMYLIYRYIFVLFETYDTMHKASASRLGYSGYRRAMKSSLFIASNLFFLSLRKASDNFLALESRCFSGEIAFLDQPERSVKYSLDKIVFIVILVLIIIFWKIGG